MDIYKILSSKTHNSHHLSRYIKFIKNLENQSFQEDEFTEIHHICPKAKDLFPEYKSFKEHPWNKIVLTARQHYIAHIMLCRVFYKSVSCTFALGRMLKSSGSSKKSVLYQKFRDVYRKELSKRMQKFSANKINKSFSAHPKNFCFMFVHVISPLAHNMNVNQRRIKVNNYDIHNLDLCTVLKTWLLF